MLRIFSRSRTIAPLLAAFVALLVSAQAWAQTTGTLRVTVVDSEMQLEIPDVTLVLTSPALIGGAQTRTTNEQGSFLFAELPPGIYKLVASKESFGGVTVENITVQINRETRQEVQLKPNSTVDVDVVAKQAAVDTSSTADDDIPRPRPPKVSAPRLRSDPEVQPRGGTPILAHRA